MRLIAVLPILLAVACSDSSPTSPSNVSPTPSPTSSSTTQPRAANLTVLVSDGTITASPVPGKFRRATFLVQLQETAGVDVHIDYMRLQVWDRIGQTEVDERTAGEIVSTFGTNKVAGGATVTLQVSFDYNLQELRTWRLTVGVTDVLGNAADYVAEGTVSSLRAPTLAVKQ